MYTTHRNTLLASIHHIYKSFDALSAKGQHGNRMQGPYLQKKGIEAVITNCPALIVNTY